MNAKKILPILLMVIFATLLAACLGGGDVDAEQVAVVVSLTQTAAALDAEPPAGGDDIPPAEIGTITGKAHLQGPPTPAMTVYAVDNATGEWFSVDTPDSDLAAPFTLEVKPGTYVLFAHPAGIGYSLDGSGLSPVTVVAGQTISDIVVSPPSQSDCGSMFGIPASPDGLHAEILGPSAECIAGIGQDYVPLNPEDCTGLGTAISQKLNLTAEMDTAAEFEDFINSKNGTGCKLTVSTTGQFASDLEYLNGPVEALLQERGWQENQAYAAGGAGGYATAYQKDNALCLLVVSVGPVEGSCPSDQPFFECMNSLSPEQRLYTLVLNCAQGN